MEREEGRGGRYLTATLRSRLVRRDGNSATWAQKEKKKKNYLLRVRCLGTVGPSKVLLKSPTPTASVGLLRSGTDAKTFAGGKGGMQFLIFFFFVERDGEPQSPRVWTCR